MGFDEVQFDYVRFPDKSGLHFALSNTRHNRTAAIVGFLQAARTRLAPYNVFVSADIFGYVCWIWTIPRSASKSNCSANRSTIFHRHPQRCAGL